MKFCNMAVIVPVDKLTGNEEVLRAQVWGKVSELLLPALGKLYRQFNPSNGAWGLKLVRPSRSRSSFWPCFWLASRHSRMRWSFICQP